MDDILMSISDTAGGTRGMLSVWISMIAGFVGMWIKLTQKSRRDRALDREAVLREEIFWGKIRDYIIEKLDLLRGDLYEEFNRRTTELERQQMSGQPEVVLEPDKIKYRRKNNDMCDTFRHLRDMFDAKTKSANEFYCRKIIELYKERRLGTVDVDTLDELVARYAEDMRKGFAQWVSREVGVHDEIQGTVDAVVPFERFQRLLSTIIKEIREREVLHADEINRLEQDAVIINHRPRRKR